MPFSQERDIWLPLRRPNEAPRVRLFCFPHAGGNAATFVAWAERLSRGIEVCALQYPGRAGRLAEPPLTRVEDLVTLLAACVSRYDDRPYAFYGHSMGAIVAFELARVLKAGGRTQPLRLFLAAHRAAHLEDSEPGLLDLPRPAFLEALRNLTGTPLDVFRHEELLELVLPTVRADIEACVTYRVSLGEPLDCPITTIGGLEDMLVGADALEAWGLHTRGSFEFVRVPGNHFFHQEPAPELMELIERHLDVSPLLGVHGTAPG